MDSVAWGVVLGESARWLGAVALVSAVLFGVVSVLCRAWPSSPPAVRVWAWRMVFLGALLTPTLHGLVSARPAPPEPRGRATAPFIEPSVAAQPSVAPIPLPTPIPYTAIMGGLGSMAAGLGLARLLWQRRQVWGLVRDGAPAAPRVVELTKDLCQHGGLRRQPTVRTVGALSTPVVCGVWRSVLAVPHALAAEPRATARGMVAHEVAHLVHRDPLWSLTIQCARAVCWWNPVFWFAGRAHERAVEQRADDTAGAWVGRRTVARALVRAAEWLRVGGGAAPASALAMAKGGGLSQRVDALLAVRHSLSRTARWVGLPLLATMILGSAVGASMVGPGPAWRSGTVAGAAWGLPAAADARAVLDALSLERRALQAQVARLDAALQQLGADNRPDGFSLEADRAVLARVTKRLHRLALQEAAILELLESIESPAPSRPSLNRINDRGDTPLNERKNS